MIQGILFLLAALVFVPIAVRLGLGSVLGYLVAGMVIGPMGFALVSDPAAILQASELGVVLMLFVIGLELEPKRLWAMRLAVFGGGTLQMLVCAALVFPLGLLMGWQWQAALVGALAMALSSTAIVVGLLQERNLMGLPVGQKGFSLLLFQDIAAIPLLGLAALLGSGGGAETGHGGGHASSPLLQLAAVLGVVVFGRFVAYPLMRAIARLRVRELFTGFALLLVLGVATLMEHVGLSMGLGAFLAGVLLASSEYRHALESDILPFKGLLLGLFFIAVGMSMQLDLLMSAPLQVLLGLAAIVSLKAVGLWLVARVMGVRGQPAALFAVLLSQVGEFAFVVLATAKAAQAMPAADADLLTLIAALSMVTTPLLLIGFDRWCQAEASNRQADAFDEERPQVLLVGFGRYGQTVARMLLGAGVQPTVIDHDADTVDSARRFGFKVYFGDATQIDLLRAAGLAHARAIVIAMDDVAQCNQLVEALQQVQPGLPLIVRARDALHAMELVEKDVRHVEREVFESSLRSARAALEVLGFDSFHARQVADDFRRYSWRFLRSAAATRHDEADFVLRMRQARAQFEGDMQEQMERQSHHAAEGGWQRDN